MLGLSEDVLSNSSTRYSVAFAIFYVFYIVFNPIIVPLGKVFLPNRAMVSLNLLLAVQSLLISYESVVVL